MKNIRKNVVYSGVGYILPMLVGLMTIPIMMKYFGEDLYGLYSICVSLIGFMIFVDLGVGQSVIKYVSQYESIGDRPKVKAVLNMAFTLYVVLGVMGGMMLFLSASFIASSIYDTDLGRINLAAGVVRITALAFMLSYINQFFLNVARAYHRFDIPSVINNTANISSILLTTLLLIMGYSVVEALWMHVVVQSFSLASGYISFKKIVSEDNKLGFFLDKSVFREIVSFSGYTFVGNLMIAITTRLDKFFIGAIISAEAVAYYQVAYTIVQMANGLIQALVQIVFPRFSELLSNFKKEGAKEILALYDKATIAFLMLSMLINVMLISSGGAFLEAWLSAEFAEKSSLTLQIISLYFFFQSGMAVAYWVIQGAGYAQITALVSVTSTSLYIAGLYWLGGHYSYNGAAVALFLLLIPAPIFFVWIEKNIGHESRSYLLATTSFLVIGAMLTGLLGLVNSVIDNKFLIIFIDGVLMSIISAGLAWYFFNWYIANSNRKYNLN